MNPCDVGGVLTLLYQSIMEDRITNQADFMYELFDAFIQSPENDKASFDAAAVNRCMNGSGRILPKEITQYYRLNPEALITDIARNIVPILQDINFVVKTLYTMLLRDRGISDVKKDALIQYYSCESKVQMARFIGEVLLNALDRPFVKRSEKTTKAVATGQASISVMGHLVDGSVPKPCAHFCGRETEVESLYQLLECHDKVFLHGIAGMGKSELAKQYVKLYKGEYANVIYLPYSGSLRSDIANLDFTDDLPSESELERFRKHHRFLRALRSDTLLIVDNFNVTATQDQVFPVILKYNCRVLFTTRSKFEGYQGLYLTELDTPMELVGKFFQPEPHAEATVANLIAQVHSHTFAVEIIARMLRKSIMTPAELLQRLQAEPLARSATDKVNVTKDGNPKKDTYYQHIHDLFALYCLTMERQHILENLVLMPASGAPKRTFCQWLSMEDGNQLDDLVELGFVMEDENQKISLQSMMRDVVLADLPPSIVGCTTLCNNLKNSCLRHGDSTVPRSLIFQVTKKVIDLAEKNDMETYLRFLEDVIPSMLELGYQAGIVLVMDELANVLANKTTGSAKDRAVLLEYQAFQEKSPQKAIGMMEKAAKMLDENDQDEALVLSNLYYNLGTQYLGISVLEKLWAFHPERAGVRLSQNMILAKGYTEAAINLFIANHREELNDFIPQICQYITILTDMGKCNEAKDGALMIEDLVRQTCGEHSHDYAAVMNTMSLVLNQTGQTELAEYCSVKSQSILQEIAQNNEGCLVAP